MNGENASKSLLEEKWSVRSAAWTQILESLSSGDNVYIWGASGTGKTLLIKDSFLEYSLPFTYINCVEFLAFASLFKRIKIAYFEKIGIENIRTNDPHKIALYLKDSAYQNPFYYVILDKAHKLLSIDVLIIQRLQEFVKLAQRNIRFVIITESFAEELFIHPDTIDRDFTPIKIFLEEYDPTQLSYILRRQYSYGSSKSYDNFFEIVSKMLFPYTSKIFHFKAAFNKAYELYLSLESSHPHEKLVTIVARELGNIEASLFQKFRCQKEYQHGLSVEAQILIVSGFICSKNPPRLDSILLKGKKKNEKRRARQEYSESLIPERFSLQRLQSVYSILLHLHQDCKNNELLSTPIETPLFCSLVNTLTQKKIFSIVTKKEPLGCEKFMCTAEYDFCSSLSDSLGIKLSEYVLDNN